LNAQGLVHIWRAPSWDEIRAAESGGFANVTNVASPSAYLAPPAVSPHIPAPHLQPEMQEKPVALTMAPSDLVAFEGRYDYGGPILTVTRDGSRLFAQLSFQSNFEIFPKSADTFAWKVVDAEVTFVKDWKGEAVLAIHRQGGGVISAPKMVEQK
jgi:hypothetical protein